MIGILQQDSSEEFATLNGLVDVDRVRGALSWLSANNTLFKEYLPIIETIYGYTSNPSVGAPLPQVDSSIEYTRHGGVTAQAASESSGLLIPDAEPPPSTSHPRNAIDRLSIGIQHPQDQTVRNFTRQHGDNIQNLINLSYSDPYLDAKVFPHLFPFGLGSWQKKRAFPIGKYYKMRLMSAEIA